MLSCDHARLQEAPMLWDSKSPQLIYLLFKPPPISFILVEARLNLLIYAISLLMTEHRHRERVQTCGKGCQVGEYPNIRIYIDAVLIVRE